MSALIKNRRVTPTVLSFALIFLSVLWFASARVFSVANEYSKDGIFQAPVWTLLLLALIPLSSFFLGAALLRARQSDDQPLKAIDYCAFAAALAPFAFLGLVLLNTVVYKP